MLLADAFRHDMLGCVGGRARTPNIDRLAGRGMVYTRAYSSLPVCAPARQALMTGIHPDSVGAYWNYDFFPTPPLRAEGKTWCEQLARRGSHGGFFGKWNATPEAPPEAFGFKRRYGLDAYRRMLDERYPERAYTGGMMGCENPVPVQDSQSHVLAREALSFVKELALAEPWHVWLDLGIPHLPCRPSEPFSRMYDPAALPPWPGFDDPFLHKPFIHGQQMVNWRLENAEWADVAQQVAYYMGMVSQIDDAIGRLLDGLEAAGQLDNTLVVFTSDHGDMCGSHRMLDKHYVLYDDIVRVPLVVAGPGVEPGVSDALVSNCLDIPSMLCAELGLPALPGAHGQPLPKAGEGGRTWITSSTNGQQFGMFNARMITDGRMKYVWNLTDIDELYDTSEDPGELVNRIDEPALAETLRILRRALYDDLSSHGDPMVRGDWVTPQLLEGRKWR